MGFVYIEGRKQWHGQEDDTSMMIAAYASYIRVPVGSIWQDYYYNNTRNSNRQTTSYLERTAHVSSFLAVQPYVPGLLSFLLLCMRVLLHIGQETVMNHAACNFKSRPLNCRNSVSTAQLVELTTDVFETILPKKRVQHTLPVGSPGAMQARPRPPPTQSGLGSKMREFRTEG